MSNHKKIQKFSNFSEEDKFWSENDSTDYIDWHSAKIISSDLKKLDRMTDADIDRL